MFANMSPMLHNVLSLVLILLISPAPRVVADHAGSTNPLDWLRVSVRGEPGVDYPIYGTSSFSLSSFSCDDRVTGVYYADPGLRCQAYHVCQLEKKSAQKMTFLCPNGTIFSQTKHVCDWWFNVNCAEARGEYQAAEEAFLENKKILFTEPDFNSVQSSKRDKNTQLSIRPTFTKRPRTQIKTRTFDRKTQRLTPTNPAATISRPKSIPKTKFNRKTTTRPAPTQETKTKESVKKDINTRNKKNQSTNKLGQKSDKAKDGKIKNKGKSSTIASPIFSNRKNKDNKKKSKNKSKNTLTKGSKKVKQNKNTDKNKNKNKTNTRNNFVNKKAQKINSIIPKNKADRTSTKKEPDDLTIELEAALPTYGKRNVAIQDGYLPLPLPRELERSGSPRFKDGIFGFNNPIFRFPFRHSKKKATPTKRSKPAFEIVYPQQLSVG